MHNVNVEQTLRGSSSISFQEQSLVVKTRLEKGITMKFLPRKILMIQMIMICPFIRALGSIPITAVCSHQQHQRRVIEMMIK